MTTIKSQTDDRLAGGDGSVCPVIGTYVTELSDSELFAHHRDELKSFVPRIIGTRGDLASVVARAEIAAEHVAKYTTSAAWYAAWYAAKAAAKSAAWYDAKRAAKFAAKSAESAKQAGSAGSAGSAAWYAFECTESAKSAAWYTAECAEYAAMFAMSATETRLSCLDCLEKMIQSPT